MSISPFFKSLADLTVSLYVSIVTPFTVLVVVFPLASTVNLPFAAFIAPL